ncbi:F-box protein At5g07610-like [Bidens hawaiensis]|uniref:F-box protein At5g07610-like n=1 Tax=Bidens hawaiensis TaxID=980011 RepID=UPI00404970BB
MKTNIKQYLKSQNPTSNKHPILLSSTDLASHDDVLTEILLRLPIRSLLRSKCVSKHWRSLISDHRFALIRNPNPNPPRGLFVQRIGNVGNPEYEFVPFDRGNCNCKPPFKKLEFDGDESTSGIIVLHSSNGLMLCYSLHEQFCKITKSIEYNAAYYVYNPTINQVVTLLRPNFQRRPRGMTLVFDPLKSCHYKVICVGGHYWIDDLYAMEIYSSETGRWKMSGKPFGNQIDTEFTGGVYWNDAVHWINKKGFIFYLKVNEDRVDRVSTPVVRDGWNVKQHCYPLVESRDCLLFIDIFPPNLKLDVHEMHRDYSGWSVKYHVDLNQVMTRFPEIDRIALALGHFRVVQPFVMHCFVEGEREEDSFLVVEIPGKAIKYNIGLKTFEELCDLELSKPLRLSVANDGFSKLGRWPGAFLFFESLSKVS